MITCVITDGLVIAKCPNCPNTWQHESGKADYNLKDDKGNVVSKYYKVNNLGLLLNTSLHSELDVQSAARTSVSPAVQHHTT
jgi:hypothetical protein